MKLILALTLSVSSFLLLNAQTGSYDVKRYARFHSDSKFIITEYVFADGHLDNYISSIPVSEFKTGMTEQLLEDITGNIEWDEDDEKEGYQMTLENETSIINAFNNALRKFELKLGLAHGDIGSISLDKNFLDLDEDQQSYLLINKVISALSKIERFSELQPFGERKSEISQEVAINKNSQQGRSTEMASNQLGNGSIKEKESQMYNGFFATNGHEDLKHINIRAIYNWIFADAYTGWCNREMILNNKRAGKLSDSSIEGVMGVSLNFNVKLEEIIDNPTMKIAAAVAFQVVDPNEGSKYAFKFKSIKPSLTSELAADQ